MVKVLRLLAASLVAVLAISTAKVGAQAVGPVDKARPVAGDAGMSTMVVIERPEIRVLEDYAEPGATRRLHRHADATFHVLVLVTGRLVLTIEGESPVGDAGSGSRREGGRDAHVQEHGERDCDDRRGVRQGSTEGWGKRRGARACTGGRRSGAEVSSRSPERRSRLSI